LILVAFRSAKGRSFAEQDGSSLTGVERGTSARVPRSR